MTSKAQKVEAAAFSIYREFISHGNGSLYQKRDAEGKKLFYADGTPIAESFEEACFRRWRGVPETVKDRFRREAEAAIDGYFNGIR